MERIEPSPATQPVHGGRPPRLHARPAYRAYGFLTRPEACRHKGARPPRRDRLTAAVRYAVNPLAGQP